MENCVFSMSIFPCGLGDVEDKQNQVWLLLLLFEKRILIYEFGFKIFFLKNRIFSPALERMAREVTGRIESATRRGPGSHQNVPSL